MLESRFSEAALLKKIVDAMKELVNDAIFEFSESGLHLQAMDSSHVSLCYLKLNKKGFEHYRCDEKASLGINLPNLGKILKCAANDDTVTLKAKEKTDVLSLMFENSGQDRIMDFDMKLMDFDQEQLQIPVTEYKCIISIESQEFKRIISDLSQLGDTCMISCDKEGVRFSVEGDIGKANITLKPGSSADDGEKTKITVEEKVELKFALRYLKSFTQATSLAPAVDLFLTADVPLLVQYQIGDVGVVQYYLAPKVEDE
mmetsp:Transcript_6349/g.10028  ORF Transcript_6349/g.10028 Transcript_6349/m.10028 type:complete len:258 (-) Transcript_6349:56-829(-)|eukprot:CAMPEP_0203765880 /NCGR_PEP_ID=MMETSP0099_2-20121227/107_1 /ASSEMBLY_ACC=CAM_ASM_000209 /TAXON_ID=96639 /ORGANISM=" , Strain NY0313808BC1" /LENGTH=257 /DNA_ID=CAMNT_0050662167 /DNA_START=147 /DNA_END=920 /DNA_ORIENTATION=+